MGPSELPENSGDASLSISLRPVAPSLLIAASSSELLKEGNCTKTHPQEGSGSASSG